MKDVKPGAVDLSERRPRSGLSSRSASRYRFSDDESSERAAQAQALAHSGSRSLQRVPSAGMRRRTA